MYHFKRYGDFRSNQTILAMDYKSVWELYIYIVNKIDIISTLINKGSMKSRRFNQIKYNKNKTK